MIEFLIIVLILVAVSINALKKKQKKKSMIWAALAAISMLFLIYMNYLMGL